MQEEKRRDNSKNTTGPSRFAQGDTSVINDGNPYRHYEERSDVIIQFSSEKTLKRISLL